MLLKTRLWWGVPVAAILCIVLVAVWRELEARQVLQVQLFKQVGEHGSVELLSGDSLVPGDNLYMTVETRRAFHVYVVNEDAAGERLVIYPCRTWGRSPRFRADQRHRLPGHEGFWPVGSVTPRERLLVIASAHPIDILDAAFGAVESPKPCAAPVSREASRWLDALEDPPEGSFFGSFWKGRDPNPETWTSTLDLKGTLSHE